MTSEWQRAVRRYQQWFGSYRKSGELKKVPVWLTLNDGRIEFITQAASWKVKRARRNPRVICFIGRQDGPAVPGTAEISSDLEPIWRVYRAYWKTHPFLMAVLALPIKRSIKAGKHVLVRVRPDEPNPFAGVTDPEL
jgi:PPOX class probable F420-dependent enzyme